jgi:anti-sigma B factor antagonist
MEVAIRHAENGVVISVEGDVDLYSSPKLREAILDSVKKKRSPLVMNLSGVTYIDSSGVATLVEGLQLSKEYGGKFRLVEMSERISEVFQLARLQQVFEICGTEAEALGS